MMRRLAAGAGRVIGLLLIGLLVIGVTAWGAGVLYFTAPGGPSMRATLSGLLGFTALVILGLLCSRRWRWRALIVLAVLLVAVAGWWGTLRPSNDRVWQPEVARVASATIQGDLVTVRNIRNFDYRSETDFTPRYEERTYDLRRLDRVDLVAVYWMGPAIAHIFLSFGFGAEHLAISIEARKERGEGYSTLGGFFRQYELIYIVADERDVIRLRTNYRKDPPEDVYIYRAYGPIEDGRRMFLDYLRTINELAERPQFYNTLTANCTNVILMHARMNPGHVPFSWKILLSGYAPEYVHASGKLDRSLPFEELKRRSHVNAAAQAADQAADFSRRIRAALPGMAAQP